MTTIATADGYSGWSQVVTADGWPTSGVPVTADGFVTPSGGGGGGGGGGGTGGQGHGGGGGGGGHHGHGAGGGFHRKRRKPRPFYRLDEIFSGKVIQAEAAYEELSSTNKAESAADTVRAFAKSEAAVPQAPSIDWAALHANAEATGRLMRLWHQHQIELDDEDFMRLLGE